VGTQVGLVYLFSVDHPNQNPELLTDYQKASQAARVHAMEFVKDGTQLLVATNDGKLVSYAMSPPHQIAQLLQTDTSLFGMAYDEKTQMLAVGDAKGRLWIRPLAQWLSPGTMATSQNAG
jgi:hypothetical protein